MLYLLASMPSEYAQGNVAEVVSMAKGKLAEWTEGGGAGADLADLLPAVVAPALRNYRRASDGAPLPDEAVEGMLARAAAWLSGGQ